MELLSHGTMMADLTDLVSRTPVSQARNLFTPSFVVLILLSQIFAVFSIWMSSKAVLEYEGATLTNAFKVWLLTWLAYAVILFGLAFALPLVVAWRDQWRIGLFLVGTGSLLITLGFMVPMKVYVITFGRAFTLLLLALVIQSVVGFVGGIGLQVAGFGVATWANQQALMQFLHQSMAPPPDPTEENQRAARAATQEIDGLLNVALHPTGSPLSLEEQEQQVALLQEKLQARRNSLAGGDAHDQAIFQNELNRYVYFLEKVKALRRVKSTNPSTAVQASTQGPSSSAH